MNDLSQSQARIIDEKLTLVASLLTSVLQSLNVQEARMSQLSESFDALEAKVAELVTIDTAVVALLDGLADRIRALGDAPTVAEINALADAVSGEASRLGAAVTRNTDPTAPVVAVAGGIPVAGTTGNLADEPLPAGVDADGNPTG